MNGSIKLKINEFKKKLMDELMEEVNTDINNGIDCEKDKYHQSIVKKATQVIETDYNSLFVEELCKEMLRSYADNDLYCTSLLEAYNKRTALNCQQEMQKYYEITRKEFPIYYPAKKSYEDYSASADKSKESFSLVYFTICTALQHLTLSEYIEELLHKRNKLQADILDSCTLDGKCN